MRQISEAEIGGGFAWKDCDKIIKESTAAVVSNLEERYNSKDQ